MRSSERRLELDERASRPAPVAAPPREEEPEPVETAHLVFAAGDRYRLLERDGPPPAPGSVVEIDGHSFAVAAPRRVTAPGRSTPVCLRGAAESVNAS